MKLSDEQRAELTVAQRNYEEQAAQLQTSAYQAQGAALAIAMLLRGSEPQEAPQEAPQEMIQEDES